MDDLVHLKIKVLFCIIFEKNTISMKFLREGVMSSHSSIPMTKMGLTAFRACCGINEYS